MKRKILSIMTVKNEHDIVEDVIISALNWSDYIIVMDNNSDDGTWDIVKQLSNKYERVILWGRFYGKFKDSIRRRIYQDFRHLSSSGDWWCRLDADEFYIDNPKEFIDSIESKNDYISSASFQYYLTEKDLKREVCDYRQLESFKCNWGEIRFFKEKSNIIWPENEGWPINLFSRSEFFIRLKHYQYRSFNQVKNRYDIRLNNTIDNNEFKHELSGLNQWYLNKGFTIPKDPILADARVVLSSELKKGNDFNIPDEFKKRFKLTNKMKLVKFLKYFISFFNYKVR